MASAAVAAATSSFMGILQPDIVSFNSGRIISQFGFGTKKSSPKKILKAFTDHPLWYLGVKALEWLDESLVGDHRFDPFGLGKPADYLQFDLDSLDLNLAKNVAGEIIGTRFESSEVN